VLVTQNLSTVLEKKRRQRQHGWRRYTRESERQEAVRARVVVALLSARMFPDRRPRRCVSRSVCRALVFNLYISFLSQPHRHPPRTWCWHPSVCTTKVTRGHTSGARVNVSRRIWTRTRTVLAPVQWPTISCLPSKYVRTTVSLHRPLQL